MGPRHKVGPSRKGGQDQVSRGDLPLLSSHQSKHDSYYFKSVNLVIVNTFSQATYLTHCVLYGFE